MPTPGLFEANDPVVGGLLDGASLRRDANNYTDGVPLDNATVDMTSNGDDELDSRTMRSRE